MPLDALPTRLQDPNAWIGTDLDNWYQRWILKYVHGWFAFGPRSQHWWAKWRRFPKILFKAKGKGPWRYEIDKRSEEVEVNKTPYLSRIQYYCRWHFAIHWPLLITLHVYFRPRDVMKVNTQGWQVKNKNKLLYFYLGAHRDSDVVYWFPSTFGGLTWK